MTATFVPEARARTRPRYLPAVDGLRGLSVLAVIAYHLDISWATGGYLGVEVFFVVSGFLITRIIIGDHEVLGRLDRTRFWIRRARRLLPAVVVLIVGVSVWAGLVIGDNPYRGDAWASLFYVQNWHLILTDAPYFDTFVRPSPLRHLWSLAIEEQFYLMWPLVLPLCIRRLRRRQAVLAFAAAGALSILWMSAIADIAAPERAYYGTDTRMFGILIGAIAATLSTATWETARQPRRWLDLVAVGAVIVLIRQLAVRSEFDAWTFPWGFVLVDLCTVVAIAAALQPGSLLNLTLGAGWMRQIGLRSYSLYLWHWPVIAFTQPSDWGLVGEHAIIVRLLFTVVLSELSYRFVELPFRYGRRRMWQAVDAPSRPWWTAGAVLASVVLLVTAAGLTRATATATTEDAGPAWDVTLRSPTTTTTTTTTTPPPEAQREAGVPGRSVFAGPTTTMAPPPPPPSVTVIGESVTLGAAPELTATFGDRLRLDAVESRQFADSLDQLDALAAENQLGDVIVIHLGNNGAAPGDAVGRIVAAAGDRRVVMLTVRVPRRWEQQVNDTVRQAAADHTNIDLLDWQAVANAEPGLLLGDGVHLTDAGQLRYAELVVGATG